MLRRAFLATTALSYSRILGANRAMKVGLIGSGGRGRFLTGEFKEIGAQMLGVCDVYGPNRDLGLKAANTGAVGFDNYKRLLDDKSFDAVVIATPDHWHARMTIDAVEAGKDAYVEKPMAHTIDEGFRMIEATRRTKRVVQVGTQRRSYDVFQEGKRVMDSGAVGDVHLVNSWWLNYSGDPSPPQIDASKLDWNQWLGSAPKRDFDPARFRNWYWYWDYSGGLMVGQAAHVLDAIHWYMGSSSPTAVTASAGRVNIKGVEVPETTCLTAEYPENYLAVFTLGYKSMRYNSFNDQLKQFHGTKARFDVGREGWWLYPQSNDVDPRPTRELRKPGSFGGAARAHIRNFLECIESRKDPNATVESGQTTNMVLCMAMDSIRSGRRLRWNNAARRVES
jgi:predicted dehydrogenase